MIAVAWKVREGKGEKEGGQADEWLSWVFGAGEGAGNGEEGENEGGRGVNGLLY